MAGNVKRRDIKYYGLSVKGDNNMRMKNVLTIVLAATVLIVASAGNAFASNGWASQSDVSQLTNSGASWYSYIDSTGEFALNGQISWQNGFNHQSSTAGPRYPDVYWAYNTGGTLDTMKDSPINNGGSWSVITYGHGQSSSGTYYIGVVHKYWDSGKQSYIGTSMNNQYYTVP